MFGRAAVLLFLVGAACGSGSAVDVTLEVRDGWVREPGAECAGSRPFLYVHRDAPFRVVDPAGAEVASGVLPAGRAVEALQEELGVPRAPTFCRFRFDVELPRPGTYDLVLDEGSPLELSWERGSSGVTVVVS